MEAMRQSGTDGGAPKPTALAAVAPSSLAGPTFDSYGRSTQHLSTFGWVFMTLALTPDPWKSPVRTDDEA